MEQDSKEIAKQVREIDPDTKLILTPIGSDPYNFRYMKYYKNLDNVWYTTHFYRPGEITFQGHTHPVGVAYPNPNHNKKKIREWLQPARDFKQEHKVKIFLGEFNCSVYSQGGGKYNQRKWLKHCIDMFEEYGWRWTYHDWKGPEIWDPEYHDNVKTLLQGYFARNK